MTRFIFVALLLLLPVANPKTNAADSESLLVNELLKGDQAIEYRIVDAPDFVSVDATDKGCRIRWHDQKQVTLWLEPRVGMKSWDLSQHSYFRIDFQSNTKGLTQIKARLDSSDDAQDWKDSSSSQVFLFNNELQTLGIAYPRPQDQYEGAAVFSSQSSKPNGHRTHWKTFNVKTVKRLRLQIVSEAKQVDLVIASIQLAFPYDKPTSLTMESLPYLDRFGQVKNLAWDGKIHESITAAGKEKQAGPLGRISSGKPKLNVWGGWESGPQLKATGFFRTTKHRGKWWFVDPNGRLFLSQGCNSVRFGGATPWDKQSNELFDWLPKPGEPIFNAMVNRNRDDREFISFYRGNLFRKYGSDWQGLAADRVHRRFRAWGLNTLGAWSDHDIMALKQTAYTPIVHLWGPFLERDSWIDTKEKVPDPFSRSFVRGCRDRLRELKAKIGDDPWCLGIFIDNEIHWSEKIIPGVLSLGRWSPAKQELVEHLKSKYDGIADLNAKWNCQFKNWEQLFCNQTLLVRTQERVEDFDELLKVYSDEYYRICRQECKREFPNHLYLGSRIHTCPWPVSHSAAKYVDVYSVNHYWFEAGVGSMPNHIDKPVLITEFHFGCLDAGVPGPSLVPIHNQMQRGRSYSHYVAAGLTNPRIVGTHWFAYVDQNALGRPGENYNIGLVDVADQPYQELVNQMMAVSELQFSIRASHHKDLMKVSSQILRSARARNR